MSSTPNFQTYISTPGPLLLPSLMDIKIQSGSILNPQGGSAGTVYDAWCLAQNVSLPTPFTYTSYLYSSYELGTLATAVPSLATSAYLGNLDNINWLLNWYNGSNAAYGDVQGAIWKMMGYSGIDRTAGAQNINNINALVSQAMAHDGYVPEVGGKIGAVLDTTFTGTSGTVYHYQPLIIMLQAASIGDTVWHDANANGIQDGGEAGIAGVNVTLVRDLDGDKKFTSPNEVLATTTTDSAGHYVFKGLTPGLDYQVVFSLPSGYDSVSPRQVDGKAVSGVNSDALVSDVVVLANGENNNTLDAGFYNKASLGDRVWLDANANGQQDAGEAGVGGVTVTLIGGGADGLISTAGDNTSATTTTDIDGMYKFTNLTPGVEYQVQFNAPVDSVFTAQDKGDDVSDSDANASGLSQIVKLGSGENNTTIDAGVYAPASLGDRVWLDANANGQQDAGEAGVGGLTVTLIGGGADGLISSAADNLSFTTTTDASGNYKFTNLTPGMEYQVQFSAPAGSVFTAQDKGADSSDSDANASGLSQIVKLASGEDNTTIDAGVYTTASIGDRVWADANGNGIQDAGEANVAGAVLKLVDADGAVIATRTTGADGLYLFDNLTPGDYRVDLDLTSLPTGYVITGKNAAGSTALNDSDADAATGHMNYTNLVSGENDRSWDAGIKAGSIGIDIQTLVHGEYTTPTGKLEGLTPGFWKTHTGTAGAALSGWPETGLSPNASYEAIFGVDVPGSAPTLLDALSANGGGVNALLRHSAAALLNASDSYLNFAYNKEQVIAIVRDAFATGNYDAAKNLLAAQNELEGSLADRAPAGIKVVTADVDANTAVSGPAIPVGGTAVFTYLVKNTGSVELGNLSVLDNRLASLTYVGGDTDHNGKLGLNEIWTYTASETVTAVGSYLHTGKATGEDAVSHMTVSDTDAAYYSSTMTAQIVGVHS